MFQCCTKLWYGAELLWVWLVLGRVWLTKTKQNMPMWHNNVLSPLSPVLLSLISANIDLEHYYKFVSGHKYHLSDMTV